MNDRMEQHDRYPVTDETGKPADGLRNPPADDQNGNFTDSPHVQIPLCDRTITTDLAGDFSLPDYQPEIKRLLRIETAVLPPNRFTGNGSVEVSGDVDYYVLYVGHDNGVYCAPLSADYRFTVSPKEAGRESLTYSEPLLCLCRTVPDPAVGRVTSPRRLNIRCRLQSHVKLYGEYSLQPVEESEGIECLTRQAEVSRVFWGLGEPLSLQDDRILSPEQNGMRVVCAEGKVLVTEATAGTRLVNCRGEVLIKLTVSPDPPLPEEDAVFPDARPVSGETEGEGEGDDGEVAAGITADSPDRADTPKGVIILQRKIPFAQTVDMEGVTPECACTAYGCCTALSVEVEDNRLHTDLNVVLDVTAQRNETVSYLKDLYSTERLTDSQRTVCPTEKAVRALNGHFTLSDSLPLSEVGMDPAARILDVTVLPVMETVVSDRVKGRCLLNGHCRIHLLLLQNQEYGTAEMTLPFRYEFDDQRSDESSSEADTPLLYNGFTDVLHCRGRMDGERIGLEAELTVSLRTALPEPLTVLSGLTFGQDTERRRGERILCFPSSGDSLWSVAKRYHTPIHALRDENDLPACDDPESPDSIGRAGYLLIRP